MTAVVSSLLLWYYKCLLMSTYLFYILIIIFKSESEKNNLIGIYSNFKVLPSIALSSDTHNNVSYFYSFTYRHLKLEIKLIRVNAPTNKQIKTVFTLNSIIILYYLYNVWKLYFFDIFYTQNSTLLNISIINKDLICG